MRKKGRASPKSVLATLIVPGFAPIAAAFANDPRVERRPGTFGSGSVLTVNSKVFAMLVKGNLVVKLPATRVVQLVAGGHGQNFDPGHGRHMKEWLTIAGDKASWITLAKEAYNFVKSV